MSELTKKELFELRGCLYLITEGKGYHEALYNKLTKMIGDYQDTNPSSMDKYVCQECNEEWNSCECKDE